MSPSSEHTPESPRKLEIGSGENPQPGYEHLDVRPDLPHLEHVHDVARPLPFRDSTFDEILSRSCLEHFSWRQVADTLRDWRRVLKPGGALKLWMPDMEYLCRMYLDGKMDQHLDPIYVTAAEKALGGHSPATWAMIKMFGGQDYAGNFHGALYDFPTLSRLLSKVGFERIERVPPHYGLNLVAFRPVADAAPALAGPSRDHHQESAVAGHTTPPPAHRREAAHAPALLWLAPIYDPSGYADEARHLILHLAEKGVEVAARAVGRHSPSFRDRLTPAVRHQLDSALARQVGGNVISVMHFPAYAFQRLPDVAYNIGRVMFETDGLPADWVAKCNEMDEIWVPGDFNERTFRAAGVRTKLFKLPGGIDADRYRPGLEPLTVTGARGTVFLSVFEWSYRKGWDVLLRAWARAFEPNDDVTLLLRAYPVNSADAPDGKREIERRIDRFLRKKLGLRRRQVAPIIVLGEQLPEDEMPSLYAAANAYVAPSRGEGWGRPHMAAMACGLPVIATRWSGNLEFMNDGNSLLLDVEALVEIDERAELPFYRGQRWAEPSVDHLVALLRRVIEQPEEMARIGERARQDVERHWRWEMVAGVAADRLRAIEAELAERGRVGPVEGAADAVAVRWEGSQFVHHSLALVNRELCLGLVEAGHELSILPYEPDQFDPSKDPRFRRLASRVRAHLSRPADVHIRHQWPPNFTPPREGHWVMMQPWEFGSMPRAWIEAMRSQVDEVWAYTSYVRDCYVRSGMPADRVHIVPLGVDTDLFRPDAPHLELATRKRFRFLFVGGTIWRKGADILLDAYLGAFDARDDVCLVIKDMGGDSFYQGQTAASRIRQLQADPNAPEILHLTADMAPGDLPGLYTACDCLVHPYRGEGFGLPIAEAMACGLPVIVTGAGACLDFCDEGVAHLIPAQRRHLPERRIGEWETVDLPFVYEPDRQAAAELMRRVFENPEEARTLGSRASQHIRERYTWRHASARVAERLRALRHLPILRANAGLGGADLTPLPPSRRGKGEKLPLPKGEGRGEGGGHYPSPLPHSHKGREEDGRSGGHPRSGVPLVETRDLASLHAGQEASPNSQSLLNTCIAEGQAALERGDLEGAASEFARVAERFPDEAAGHGALGSTLMALGRLEEAVPALRRAAELAPRDADVHNQLGVALFQLNDLDGSEVAFQRARQADPDGVQALLNLIDLYRFRERYVEATETVKDAMRTNPHHADVLAAFGTLSLELGDLEGGEMALHRLQSIQPDHPDVDTLRQAIEGATEATAATAADRGR